MLAKLSRANQVLIGLLLVQLIALAVIFFPRSADEDSAVAVGGALLSDFDPAAVSAITLTDNQGASLSLARDASGAWVFPAVGNFPADIFSVNDLLTKLGNLSSNRLIAENRASHNRLGVGDNAFERKIEITRNGRTETLYIGTSAGANATHMRVNDAEAVFLVGGLAAFEITPQYASWIDRTYFRTPIEGINAVTIENADGLLSFAKDEAGEWTMTSPIPDGREFDPARLQTFLTQISTLQIEAPLGLEDQPQYALDTPLVTLTITSEEEVLSDEEVSAIPDITAPEPAPVVPETVENTYTVRVGATLPEGGNPMFISGGAFDESPAYYVRLAAFTAEYFSNLTVDDFLAQVLEDTTIPEPIIEPTAEPTQEPTEEPTAELTVEPTVEPTEEATSEPND